MLEYRYKAYEPGVMDQAPEIFAARLNIGENREIQLICEEAELDEQWSYVGKERVRNNFPVWHPVFVRSSIKKARNRTTIPALLFNQNERIRAKSGHQTGKLLRTRS